MSDTLLIIAAVVAALVFWAIGTRNTIRLDENEYRMPRGKVLWQRAIFTWILCGRLGTHVAYWLGLAKLFGLGR